MTMSLGTLVPQTRCGIRLAIRRRSPDDAPPDIVMIGRPSGCEEDASAERPIEMTP
jgi:hypothetical protein